MSVVVTRKRRSVRPDARNVVRGQETRRRILDMARARILEAQAYRLANGFWRPAWDR